VVIGDFNEICFSHEKDGGNARPPRFMQAFREALDDCGLEDLGFTGDPFTWKHRRMRQRLDRAVATNSWSLMHPGAVLQHLGYIRSDHRPILQDTEYKATVSQQNPGPKRFEAK
jgi:endonuclease/exonuclease/phosphatase family metal-dependent hydrolase